MKKTITMIAFGLLSISLSAQIPTNGLLGYWPFNGNANDQSGNNLNGIISGATLTTDRFGNINSAYNFNSSDYIEILPNSILDNDSISISCWIKPNNINSTFSSVIKKGTYNDGSNESFALGIKYPSTIQSYIKDGSSCVPSVGWLSGTTNTSNTLLNNWSNIIYVYANQILKIYFNGNLVSTEVINGNINFCTGASLIFGREWQNGYNFNGVIDDIGYWNRPLTPVEIVNIYNVGLCYQTITVTDTLIINTTITGFNPVTFQNTIKIWPNPTNDHITIDNGNIADLTGYQIKITNSLSQQVFQSAITQQQFYVDLSTWTGNGIYFVHIIDGQGNTIDIKKIILQ
jgi:hypothetical protein